MDISRFNPHAMPDATIRVLSTGRDALLDAVVESLTQDSETRQHVLVSGHRGLGKSFFVRTVEVALKDRGAEARMIVLPEEQRNITTPASFLREINRAIKGAPPASLPGVFLDDAPGDWDEARAEMRASLEDMTEPFAIVAIENFDELMAEVFSNPADQSKLRVLLQEERSLSVLATALTASFDQDYEQRLFHAFSKFELSPWDEADHILYFERRARLESQDPSEMDRGKIRALAHFTGGSPRMTIALADLLLENDPLSAAELLDKLVDELTPYYQNLISQMPARTKTLFDALIRQHEPCSQSELAERVGTTQNRIAQHFSWLRERHLVIGKKRQGRRDFLYQVADRLFVQYYRKRHLLNTAYTPLAGMAELLDGFFSVEENKRQAVALLEEGRRIEASEFVRAFLKTDGGELGAWANTTHNQDALNGLTAALAENHKLAIVHFEKAEQIATSEGDRVGAALVLGQLGVSATKSGANAKAIEAHQRALTIWRELGDESNQAWALGQLAQNFRFSLQFDDALNHASAALEIWKSQGANDRVASLLGDKGETLRRSGQAKAAVDVFLQARDIWKSLNDRAAEAWVLGGLGLAKKDLGDFREAVDYHGRAVDILADLEGREFSVALNFGWMAISFRKLYDYKAAIDRDEAALELWKVLQDEPRQVRSMTSIAINLAGMNEFNQAIKTLTVALRKARDKKYHGQYIWTAAKLAKLYVAQGDVERVWPLLDDRPVNDTRRIYETVLTECGAALNDVIKDAGRPEAFRTGRLFLEGLVARRATLPPEETVTYLVSGVIAGGAPPALAVDLAQEMVGDRPVLPPERIQALELATHIDRNNEQDLVLEDADPDVAAAVRAVLSAVKRREARE